jgi:hypothetical protein
MKRERKMGRGIIRRKVGEEWKRKMERERKRGRQRRRERGRGRVREDPKPFFILFVNPIFKIQIHSPIQNPNLISKIQILFPNSKTQILFPISKTQIPFCFKYAIKKWGGGGVRMGKMIKITYLLSYDASQIS